MSRVCTKCENLFHQFSTQIEYCPKCLPDNMRCRAITVDGKRCKNPAIYDSLCNVHSKSNGWRKKQETSAGYIYIVYLGKPTWYKIGLSIDVEKRMESGRAFNPWLEVIWAKQVPDMHHAEKTAHDMNKINLYGREVFRLSQEDLDGTIAYLESLR